jgi:protein-arginine kinase activator protein McsA
MEMYCLKCEAKTETIDVQNITSKNGRPMLKGICSVCRRYKTQFVKAEHGGDLVSSLNSVTSNIKLPWAKFKGEVHLPGMNFQVLELDWIYG